MIQDNYRYTYRENTLGSLIYLSPEQIRLPQGEKKREESPNAVIRLAESIKRYGILEPLSVRLMGDSGGFPTYELASGRRRLAAARLAGIDKLPCIVLARDDKSYAISEILERLGSKRLNIFEQAMAYRLLIEEFTLTQEEIAQKMGVSQSAIANKLRLLRFSPDEQAAILSAKLTERHARALLRLTSPEQRAEAIDRIKAGKLNVAATESLVEGILSPTKPSVSVVLSPQTPPKGVCPRKFAMQDLRPLYNSIERTLAIFRKTGEVVECSREESEDGVRINIYIPKRA